VRRALPPSHRRRGRRFPHRPWRGHRLFWRIFGHGLFLIVLVLVAVGAVALFFGEGWWREGDAAAGYAAERVADLRNDPQALATELARVRQAFGVIATVYAADGRTILASSADPPLPPRLDLGAKGPRGFPERHGGGRAMPLRGGGQVVFAFEKHGGHHPGRLTVLLVVLCVIALGSIPLARSIAAPIEKLTRAAQALGAGDLSTRAQVRAKGEVGELARAFDEMAERIEAQVRSEKELLANVSHEVRTPLARIRVALELAAEGDLDRARRFLGEIGSDLDELDRLVEDVLATARLDLAAHGGVAIRREPVDLAAVAADAARRFAERWPVRTLETEAPAALPPVSGDPALLRRLLDNLLDNAAKYSEAPAPVRLSARGEPGAAVLEVKDRGIGISAEDLPNLFTPFFRTDRSRTRNTGGVGLGLALARRIARAHGGDIEVASEVDKGTVFRVRIPAG
jgi:two-component system OmpR family sensor kinase